MVYKDFEGREIIFDTHSELDEYVRSVLNKHGDDAFNGHEGHWKLLKAFDRAFWAHKSTMEEIEKGQLSYENCPFGNPRNALLGSMCVPADEFDQFCYGVEH